MQIERNKSLYRYNTFNIPAKADFFVVINHISDIQDISNWPTYHSCPKLVLGGGSNILFTQDFKGLVLHSKIMGIEHIDEDSEYVFVKVGSGELWHSFVLYCIEKEYFGIENLSLIPGTVGASPIQNIGAYGVEVKEVVHAVHAIHVENGSEKIFTNAECNFGYRDSIFKKEAKGKWFITHVAFKLGKKPKFQLEYGAIREELEKRKLEVTLKNISDVIISIRKSKLPDPGIIGNAGSFFKNPTVAKEFAHELKAKFPKLVFYPHGDGQCKLAAGWLIEQCGWKGKQIGNTGAHKDQALVLVNYGNATGCEIKQLAEDIARSVFETFGVQLETEVNIL